MKFVKFSRTRSLYNLSEQYYLIIKYSLKISVVCMYILTGMIKLRLFIAIFMTMIEKSTYWAIRQYPVSFGKSHVLKDKFLALYDRVLETDDRHHR